MQDNSNNVIEQFTTMNKSFMDVMLRMQEINDKALKQLSQQQMEAMGVYLESGVEQARTLSEAKSPADIFPKQAELISGMSEKMMSHAKQTMDIFTTSRDDLTALMNENLRDMMVKMKSGLDKTTSS